MSWKLVATAALGTVLAASLVLPADAAPRKRPVAARAPQHTVFISRDEDGRTRTRLIVTPRSFLDGGTEVLPGQRKYTDYVNPPGYRPIDILGPGKGYDRMPLNGPFDYGYSNW